MAYTGKRPGNVNTDFLEAGGELANHDEVTVDASGNITATSYAGDGSSLSGITQLAMTGTVNPTITTNPTTGLGTIYTNSTDGSVWVLFDATTDNNKWKNETTGTIIQPNLPPTNPTNTGSFPASANKDESFSFTFDGATDSVAGTGSPAVTHYLVDNFSSSNMTVTTAEVAAGSAHNFTVGPIAIDENFSFRVRAKDNNGAYSSGVTVNLVLYAIVLTDATGGTVTYSGSYTYHTFTSSGTFTVNTPGDTDGMEYLVVAGGGGGSRSSSQGGGGGGAGGYRSGSGTLTAGAHSVTVGGGGSVAANGGNSSVFGLTSTGGGRGGDDINVASSGGSGGGGGQRTISAGSGTAGQGNAGGISNDVGWNENGGGGGGASAAGTRGVNAQAGPGGNGTSWINGTTYAGGGGGAAGNGSNTKGAGGTGGGGTGGQYNNNTSPTNGTANTGGGAGGASNSGQTAATGGSGVVIIRYLT